MDEITALLGDKTRRQIVQALKTEPKYISELSRDVGVDRATVSYHLSELQRAGLLNAEYRILEEPKPKGKAARYYSINEEKWKKASREIHHFLER